MNDESVLLERGQGLEWHPVRGWPRALRLEYNGDAASRIAEDGHEASRAVDLWTTAKQGWEEQLLLSLRMGVGAVAAALRASAMSAPLLVVRRRLIATRHTRLGNGAVGLDRREDNVADLEVLVRVLEKAQPSIERLELGIREAAQVVREVRLKAAGNERAGCVPPSPNPSAPARYFTHIIL